MNTEPRQPRAFTLDDPALVTEPELETAEAIPGEPPDTATLARPTFSDVGRRSLRWGALLLTALAGAASLGLAAWFARFVSAALARDDWVGTATLALLLIAAFAALMIALRELIGFSRLARLTRLRSDVAAALGERDRKRERRAALRLAALYAGRRELAWGIKRFRDHARDVHDPGELLALAEREILSSLDSRSAAHRHPVGQARCNRDRAQSDGPDCGLLCADREPAAVAYACHTLWRPPGISRRREACTHGFHPHRRDRAASP